MATRKQLISESLTTLGHDIIAQQCQLKQLIFKKLNLLDTLVSMDEKEEKLRHSIKSLKDKVEWEIKENRRLMAAQGKAQGGQPQSTNPLPPRLPGDEWQDAS